MIESKRKHQKKQWKNPLILLTNDDGFFAEGINILQHQLEYSSEVFIVAPDREKSAASLSITLHRPLRVQKIKSRVFSVDGTPADCIYLALQKLLPRQPSLIISGLNHGPNVGQQDISYSGTVAGAIQAAFLQIPSLAVSVLHDEKGHFDFNFSAWISSLMAKELLKKPFSPGLCLNINIPFPPVKGIKVARLGQKRYNPEIIEKKDPRLNTYFWIGSGSPKAIGDKDSDVMMIKKGYITVTPLHTDLTDYQKIKFPILKKTLTSINHEIFKKNL